MNTEELFHLTTDVLQQLQQQSTATLRELRQLLPHAQEHHLGEALRFACDCHLARMAQAKGGREYTTTDFGRLMLMPSENRALRALYGAAYRSRWGH